MKPNRSTPGHPIQGRPTSPPWQRRGLIFLYSHGNIAGCSLALAGPLLLFAGVIGPLWWAITLGLYAAGYLLAPRTPELERRIAASLSHDEVMKHLDRLIAQAAPHLGPELARTLARLRETVAQVLPRLSHGGPDHGELFTVRETVLSYLPETLANYVALPPAFRASHVLKDGLTARQHLGRQLDLLDRQLRQIAANVATQDADALLAHGRFLEAKFSRPDFLSV
ncbi:hypothetical protein AACH06_18880 [Ideonella sp. DXS29W]|uniref:5-bromo-4-chloroindolyl phosphate hydrolase n=1 Tax=Ideonella lacteola TaxID=2984193 RepID=A0ABU9BSE2_9BURK